VGTVTDRYSEIDDVVAYIHQRIYEPLLLSRLAGYAGYSPYHFTRIFKERIGLPPCIMFLPSDYKRPKNYCCTQI
jgi:AraC-like DNA-binding protein